MMLNIFVFYFSTIHHILKSDPHKINIYVFNTKTNYTFPGHNYWAFIANDYLDGFLKS